MRIFRRVEFSGRDARAAAIFIIEILFHVSRFSLSMILVRYCSESGEKKSIYPGKWCLPCGYIEYDETYVEAAAREIKEETGITSPPDGIINVVSNQFDNGVHSLVVVMISYYHGDEPLKPGDDIIDAGWFDVAQLPPLAFSADVFIIGKYERMLAEGGITTLTLEGNSVYGH